MPKIPPLTSRKVIAILEKKGFTLVRTKGSHHIFRNEETGRQVTIPLHPGDLPPGTLHEIVRQAGDSHAMISSMPRDSLPAKIEERTS